MIRQHGGNVVIHPSKYSVSAPQYLYHTGAFGFLISGSQCIFLGPIIFKSFSYILIGFTGTKTFICIAADGIPTLKVKRLIETKSYNIATVDWLVRALGGDAVKKKLLKFQPQDMICCTEAMNDAFSKRFDAYGDSFTKPITVGDMKVLLDRIQLKVK